MTGGWGSGWGSTPWGSSSSALLAGATDFDLFCFQGVDTYHLLADADAVAHGVGSQFVLDSSSLDFGVFSGGSYPTDDARVVLTKNIPSAFTVEWVLKASLPNNFTDLVNSHVFLGTFDAAGPVLGLFFSKIGVAYTGSVSFPGGTLQLDTVLQVIPGSSAWVLEDEYLVVRAAADLTVGLVYLYITPLNDIAATGQVLRAILPIIPSSAAAVPPTDQTLVSVRGTVSEPNYMQIDSWCLGSALIIPNLAPVADAGADVAVRSCSIVQLDGSASFDPEMAPLLYSWRLLDAPIGSSFAFEGGDGRTWPLAVPTGFTAKFHSTELGIQDALDPFTVGVGGDVLVVAGTPYTLVAKGIDANGFYVQVEDEVLPEAVTGSQFKVLRQRGISSPLTVAPTFFPDIAGFYVFDLIVFDGTLYSAASPVVVNVLESALPRGCVPDLSFVFNYLSDFWNLVEGKERIADLWSSTAQAAATELFSLWQVEYSKSHRDIQRTFNRRWLHYDTLLGEPLPELTTIRTLFGGITSTYFSDSGASGIYGTSLVLSSPALAVDASVTIRSLDPVSPTTLAAELNTKLRATDDRFSVTVVALRGTSTAAVRIYAPFPLTIAATTSVPVFFTGSEGRPPSGGGVGVGSMIYKVDRSLAGLGIVEDDFLALDGTAYRIARLVDDPTDDFAYQRVALKERLPLVPSSSWSINGWVSSELLDFYNGLVCAGDYVDIEASDSLRTQASVSALYTLVETRCVGVNEALPDRIAIDSWPIGAAVADPTQDAYLARVIRRKYVPVHADVVDVPVLVPKIVIEDEESSLRRNVDYFIEPFRNGKAIRFVVGDTGDAGDIWEGERPLSRLWAEYTYLDNSATIEANFGIPVDLTIDQLEELPDTVDYLSAVRGLWFAYFNGPSVRNIRVGVQILLGLPFAEQAGVIEEIRTDFSAKNGRMLVRDAASSEIVRAYRWPKALGLEINPSTGEPYAVGDAVTQFAPLVRGAEVLDWINSPKWFEGILNQGIFYEVEKFNKFLVRVDSAAFNLSALTFVRNFVLKIKPAYTYPLFIVNKDIAETEVSTTDSSSYSGYLTLSDAPCAGNLGTSFHFDQSRPAGGGYRNQFDSDADPNNADPSYPTPDADVFWGFDKGYFCAPSTQLLVARCETFSSSFTVPFDSCFAFDTPVMAQLEYKVSGPTAIPAGPAGYVLPPFGGPGTATLTGNLVQLRLQLLGDPGSDPTDYEAVVLVNSVEQHSEAFTAGTNTEIVRSLSVAIAASDTVSVHVRPASGGARTTNWSLARAVLLQQDTVVWTFDDTLSAGTYCQESEL